MALMMGVRVVRNAVFLDKDGTLVDNSRYPVVIPSDVLLVNDIIEGLLYLQRKGYVLIIVSNQPWIAKKKMTKEEVEAVFAQVCSQLKLYGVFITAFYYCPHQTSDNCTCKKPNISLIQRAAHEYTLDLGHSFMVGDMDVDICMGKAAGLKTILVLTGKGNYALASSPDYIIPNLNHISEVI